MPVHQESDVYGLQLVKIEIGEQHLNPFPGRRSFTEPAISPEATSHHP